MLGQFMYPTEVSPTLGYTGIKLLHIKHSTIFKTKINDENEY